jgi:hypothetical protein
MISSLAISSKRNTANNNNRVTHESPLFTNNDRPVH